MRKFKILAVFTVLSVICLAFASCGANGGAPASAQTSSLAENSVELRLNDTVYTNDMESIDAVWYNNSSAVLTIGEAFWIEKNEDGKWTKLSGSENIVFEDYAIEIPSEKSYNFTYKIKAYFGDLEPGEYRISAEYSLGSSNDLYTANAEFTIE